MEPCNSSSTIRAAIDALPKPATTRPTAVEIWGIGFVAVTIINSCAAVGIAIMPLLGRRSYYYLLTTLIGLGVGSLSGSALFHLLPEAFQLDETKDNFIWKAWTAVAGVYLFFLVEKFLNIVVKMKRKTNEKRSKEIAPVAWMIIFGDAIHNFVDGLSIGAAFTASVLSGVSVCVAVVCEEFPHEFGDVAILVSSGMSVRKALGYNLLSALTCYLGFIIGVLVGELAEATVYIFALAAGMFLYVALANMVPEMNSTMDKAMNVSMRKGMIILVLQFLGIAAGLAIMFLLAFYESHIKFE